MKLTDNNLVIIFNYLDFDIQELVLNFFLIFWTLFKLCLRQTGFNLKYNRGIRFLRIFWKFKYDLKQYQIVNMFRNALEIEKTINKIKIKIILMNHRWFIWQSDDRCVLFCAYNIYYITFFVSLYYFKRGGWGNSNNFR